MIEVYELRQFIAFTEYRTLSEAAEILHLSRPALSRSMKKLEEDLGISLFIRNENFSKERGRKNLVFALPKGHWYAK